MEILDYDPWKLEHSTMDERGVVFERYVDGNNTKLVYARPTGEVVNLHETDGRTTECTVSFPNRAVVTFYETGGLRATSPTGEVIDLPTAARVSDHFGSLDKFTILNDRFGADMWLLFDNMRQWREEMELAMPVSA